MMYKLKVELSTGRFFDSDLITEVTEAALTNLVREACRGELSYLQFMQNGHTVFISATALQGCIITIVKQPPNPK